jgi:hypothetical protein
MLCNWYFLAALNEYQHCRNIQNRKERMIKIQTLHYKHPDTLELLDF